MRLAVYRPKWSRKAEFKQQEGSLRLAKCCRCSWLYGSFSACWPRSVRDTPPPQGPSAVKSHTDLQVPSNAHALSGRHPHRPLFFSCKPLAENEKGGWCMPPSFVNRPPKNRTPVEVGCPATPGSQSLNLRLQELRAIAVPADSPIMSWPGPLKINGLSEESWPEGYLLCCRPTESHSRRPSAYRVWENSAV
jgi:hypothetical protein